MLADIREEEVGEPPDACGMRKGKTKARAIPPPKIPLSHKTAGLISWRHSPDPPTSVGHLAFLLDCFVLSFGPDMPQLGRYHPQSDPEEYAVREDSAERWSLAGDDELGGTWSSLLSSPGVKFERMGASYKAKGGKAQAQRPSGIFVPTSEGRSTSTYLSWDDMMVQQAPSENAEVAAEFPNDDVIRELSEMRLILERLLENRDLLEFYDGNGLREILSMLPDSGLGNLPIKEPMPHFPVGDWKFEECGICLVVQWLYRRPCCGYSACTGCLQKYYTQRIEQGLVQIECCNVECQSFVHRDEISARLDGPMKEKFHTLLVLANDGATSKTCPRCNHVTEMSRRNKRRSDSYSVVCASCELHWCFACHAPWHESLTCKQFRKGDRLLKSWAREKNHGQLNAQKCPKCKIYIQRTTGCDHMHCNRCKTDFCYKCGDRFRHMKFFGDHYSKLSIFGCKYRFKADRPVQRKFIRGAIFGGKVVAAPVLGVLALCAGALAVGISVVALPVYGGVRLYRHCEGRQQAKAVRRQPQLVARSCMIWEPLLVIPENRASETTGL